MASSAPRGRGRGDQKLLNQNSKHLLDALDTSLEFCARQSHDKQRKRIVRDFAGLDRKMGETAAVVGETERLAVELQAVQALLVHEALQARTLEGDVTSLTARLCNLSDEVAAAKQKAER